MVLMGLDLAPRKCGWCAGHGAIRPTAGGFALPAVGDDMGYLLDEFDFYLQAILARFYPEAVVYEAPILPGGGARGSLIQRRGQFCMGPYLELVCRRRGIQCREADPKRIKMALAGDSTADKDAMVAMAERLRITLPSTKAEGREDAADAVGAWLVAVAEFSPLHLPLWDKARYQTRGGLI